MPRWTQTLEERFLEKFMPEPNSGCWLWDAYHDPCGYGRIQVDGRSKSAHLIAYELYKGPVPDGLQVDHLCNVRCCVNPDHLEAVTTKENNRRVIERGCHFQLNQTHCKRGHPLEGDNLYVYPSGKRMCRICHRISGQKADRKRRKQ